MRVLLLIISSLLLSACDYTVPLVTQPKRPIDARAIGLWQQTDNQKTANRLMLLPLDEQEYLVAFPKQQKDTMYARATLWQENGLRLIQLNWIGTAQGTTPKNNRTYQYAHYSLDGNQLTVSLLNPDVVSKNIDSREKLARAIREHKDDARLFRKPMHFRRITDKED